VALAVVGGGPAVLGLLTAACAEDGVGDYLTVIHAGPPHRFGAGRLPGYAVRSDTRARVFAECVEGLAPPAGSPAAQLLRRCSTEEPVPLRVAGALLAVAGQSLLGRLRADRRVTVLDRTRVVGLRAAGESVALTLRTAGHVRSIEVGAAVLGIGGAPIVPADQDGGRRPGLHSDAVLRRSGRRELIDQLDQRHPRVTIVGGSHSAFAVAQVLLRSGVPWTRGAIRIAHRSRILLTYGDIDAARADGEVVYPDDVCPVTGLVHRFGGLRTDSAALFRRIRDGVEPRVRLVGLTGGPDALLEVTSGVEPVVWATGYGSPVDALLESDAPATWDPQGRLVVDRSVVPRVYGLGLGTRRRRGPGTGGEAAFTGSIDGVWFYQQVVAPQLLELVRARTDPAGR
jgi:L-lysine 6-monooxygenase (NADPH-requiring)